MTLRRAPRVVAAGGLLLCAALTVPALAVAPATAAEPRAERAHVDQWWYDALNLDEVHEEATGEGVVVAVFDGYLDRTVPDLAGADIEMKRDCYGEKPAKQTGIAADHATAMVTAIVGQGTGNAAGGRGVLGIAPDATVRHYTTDTVPDNGVAECDGLLAGPQVVQAARDGADVISLSVGGWTSFDEKYIRRAHELGAVVVAAGGDRRSRDGLVEYPAGYPESLAILAADDQGTPWEFNPRPWDELGGHPDLTLPGVDIEVGGVPRDTGRWTSGATRSGTSAPTALAAGAFAVLKSRWPDATNNQLIQAMLHHTSNVEDGELAYDPELGFGYLSLTRALPVDPAGYPDVNPTAMRPRQAVEQFPASGYGQAEDDSAEGSGDAADEAPSGDASPAAAESGTAGDEQAGPPLAMLVGGGIALVVLAGAVLAVRRRGSNDVPAGTAPRASAAGGGPTEGER